MTRRRSGVALVVVGLAAVLLSLSARPASAVPEQTGWWFVLPVLVPVPVVPDGGLFVQQGPDGPMALGALRYSAPAAAGATLTLTAAQGFSTAALPASLAACAVSAPWTPPAAAPGAWDDRPAYSDQCTLGAVSSDGTVVAFYFDAGFVAGDVLDVAIVPQAGAQPFAIAFDAPAADALALKAAPVGPPPTAPVTTAVAVTVPSGGGGPVTVSPPATVPPTTTPVTVSVTNTGTSGPADTLLKLAGLGDRDRGQRALALAGASLILVGWWLTATRGAPAPRLLLAGVGGREPRAPVSSLGGIGRFARIRASGPRRLR